MNLESSIRNNINNANHLVDELHNDKAKFELQLHEVNKSVITTLLSVRNMINNMPLTMYESLNEHVGNEINTAVKSYKTIMNKKELLFERSGLKYIPLPLKNNNIKYLK